MKRPLSLRLAALILALTLLPALPASALTPDQCRELLEAYYVDPVPAEVLEQDTVEGMISALGDPYTEYLSPQDYAAFLASMADEELVGVGIASTTLADGFLVHTVYDGPARAGGIRPGDLIVAVDGKTVPGQPSDTVVSWIRGEAGTDVTLTYIRDGVQYDVTVTRAPVVVPTVEGEVLEGRVGYLRCKTWGNDTVVHFRELIEALDDQVDTWYIDLRNNTGGFTSAALDSAALFVDARRTVDGVPVSDPLLYLAYGDGERVYFDSDVDQITDKPMILAVNGLTASSSEVFAAILRCYDRALLVGSRTYGKGVSQSLLDSAFPDEELASWFADGDCLKLTTARFYAPSGNTNDTLGLLPDLPVSDSYTYEVGCLLAAATDGTCLAFTLGGAYCAVDMSHIEDPAWKPVYGALLDGLPDTQEITLPGLVTSRQELADAFDLPLRLQSFTDLYDFSAPLALAQLQTFGLVSGETFRPDAGLTRAELCGLLHGVMGYVLPDSLDRFSDVPPDAPYAAAVNAMAQLGLVNGVGGGAFDPDAPLDLQQLFTVSGRLCRRLNCFADDAVLEAEAASAWGDTLDSYDPWARSSVYTLSGALSSATGPLELLWDAPDQFDPTAAATRDDAAWLIRNILYRLDILP